MEHRNRSIPQLATDASSTALDGAAATPHGNNHDILREIAEQMKRTPEDIDNKCSTPKVPPCVQLYWLAKRL